MSLTLLSTKLYFPPVRSTLVSRPRLVERLQNGLTRPFTLISAPAGFGKTTLLSEWRSGVGRDIQVAWLSLDAADNDWARFLQYLFAALDAIRPGLYEQAQPLLQSIEPLNSEAVLTLLVNSLSPLSSDFVFVLDDYQFIETSSIHEALAFLLDHLPARMHLVILTRADPALPLARLRARGQLTEIRAEHLRFSGDEAAQFLNRVMDLGLTSEQVAALEKRSEGWIAGLQLAALSIQGREDANAIIDAVSGNHQYIVDYLVEEVLNRQAAPMQTFLLETSILDRMSGSLCDALTENTDGQAALEAAERANLFVIALDQERRWYRYHHLFADVLRRRLQQMSPAKIPQLHRRAADWHEKNGFIEETLNHALAAGDFDRALRLAGQNCRKMVFEGRISTALKWIEALPDSLVRANPFLSGEYAWILYTQGKLGAAEQRIKDATEGYELLSAGRKAPENGFNYASLPGLMSALQALIHARKGETQPAVNDAQQALESCAEGDEVTRSLAYIGLAAAYREMGEINQALQIYEELLPTLPGTGNLIASARVSAYIIQLTKVQGKLSRAFHICQEFLAFAEQDRQAQIPAYGIAHVAIADVLCELNLLDEAEHHLKDGLEQGKLWRNLELLKTGYVVAARLKRARGDWQGALADLQEAAMAARQSQVPVIIAEVASRLARLHAEMGDLARASRWVEVTEVPVQGKIGLSLGVQALNYARVLVALGRMEESLELLSKIEAATCEGENVGWQIEVHIVQAMALKKGNNLSQALEALRKSLSLAEPEGYRRIFLDEGAAMTDLLQLARSRGIAKEFITDLLLDLTKPPDTTASSQQPLIEPLTARELEVLRLIALGHSNKEIAQKLFITIGTVKAHSVHIFQKLEVPNRTQAAAHAKELGLL